MDINQCLLVLQKLKEFEANNNYKQALNLVNDVLKFFSKEEYNQKEFYNLLDVIYNSYITNTQNYNWEFPQLLNLLNEKVYILLSLKKYNEAKEVNQKIKMLTNNCADSLIMDATIARFLGDIEFMQKSLDLAYVNVWNNIDYANFLISYAWLYMFKKDYENVKYYLSLSTYYSNEKSTYQSINNLVYFIKDNFNFEITRPSIEETLNYFKDNKHLKPTSQNIKFSVSLYKTLLKLKRKTKDDMMQAILNLNYMNRENPYIKEQIDVEQTTLNRLVVNRKNGFMFQVPKSLQENNIDLSSMKKLLYKFTSNKKHIFIFNSAIVNKNDTNKMVNNYINTYKEKGYKFLQKDILNISKYEKVYKVLFKSKTNNYVVVYWFKTKKNMLGKITGKIEKLNGPNDVVMKNIVMSWTYL